MKKIVSFIISLALVSSMLLTGCGNSKQADNNQQEKKDGKKLKVVMLINGTLGDKSFYDSADAGMKMIKEKYGDSVETKTIEMGYDQTKWQPTLEDISEQDWDLICAGTWQMKEPFEAVAPNYPDKKYVIFDTAVDYDKGDYKNVYSILYKQNEGAYVIGALAAKVTNSKMPFANTEHKIGFLGVSDIPVINDFLVGYIQGAKSIDNDVKVSISYVGSPNDSAKGKEMALSQYNKGVDIAFNVAGQSGLGLIDAAKETKKYALGVDSDQALLFKDTDPEKAKIICSSLLKRVDVSILRAFELFKDGKLTFGQSEALGFKEDCIGIAENDIYNEVVSEDIRKEINTIKEKIVKGEVNVDTAFGMDASKIDAIRNSVK